MGQPEMGIFLLSSFSKDVAVKYNFFVKLIPTLTIFLSLPLGAQGKPTKDHPGKVLTNLLLEAPYSEKEFGRRKLVDENYLQLMQIALLPGQAVPKHQANSNVYVLVLDGELVFELDGVETKAKKGDLLPVAFKTPMAIRNVSKEKATFSVWKTPNPSEMKK